MTSEQDNASQEPFADLLDDLGVLADRIDRRRRPGQAWAAPRAIGRLRRLLWPAAAAVTAAAAMWLIAAWVQPRPIAPPSDPVVLAPVVAPHVTWPRVDWTVPADIHISGLDGTNLVAGLSQLSAQWGPGRMDPMAGLSQIRVEASHATAPSNVQMSAPGHFTWSAPTLSF